MKRIAPPNREYRPYGDFADTTLRVVKAFKGKNLHFYTLMAMRDFMSSSLIPFRRGLSEEDHSFFSKLIMAIGSSYFGNEHNEVTKERLDEAVTRANRLKEVIDWDSGIKY